MRWVVAVLVVVAAVVGFYALVPYGAPQLWSGGETFVEIAPGTSTAGIARQLEQAGVLRSRYVLEAMKVVHGGTLKAGEYRFDHPATPAEVYARLRRGDVFTLTLVIPEGYNLFDIADAVAGAGFVGPGVSSPTRDGEAVTDGAPRSSGSSRDVADIVTMASLVEKEVHIDAERAEVASVFENRLAAGMPLQTDPAVVYASMLRGTWTGVIHQSELHSDSAYNTYAHRGLPPGPICNPGLAAMQAALHPAKTDYLYFVADAKGTTRFAATLAEHNANVAAYRAASVGP